MTKNRKMFDALIKAGYTDREIADFCEKYLELIAEAMMDGILPSSKGVADTKLADKMLTDRLVYKRNGKLYFED